MATVNCLVIHILQNIFFCAQKKKETRTGLEQHEDNKWQNFQFCVNCPFKCLLKPN